MNKHDLIRNRENGKNGKGNKTPNRLNLKNLFIIAGFVLATVIVFCYIIP